jgi:uncharacterized phage protein gp47/JayE
VPFDRPTLTELIDRTRGDFRGRLGITGALLRRATANVLALVWAGAVHETHGHLVWVADQLFGDTAIREFLLRLAAKYGITPTPADFAVGTVLATGTDTSVILIGEVLVRDDEATFTVTLGGVITGGEASISVKADLAGLDGNMLEDDTLDFQNPIAGVDTLATVEAPGLEDGLDEESTEDLRARYLLRRREPPSGGGDQDYEAWSLAVAGITRAWIARHEDGLGTVKIRCVEDNEVDIFPGAPKIAEVQAAIDALRPTTAEPTVEAPIQLDVDYTIELVDDTTANRAAVSAELADLTFRDGVPGDGISLGTIFLSAIRTAIGNTAGGDYTLTVPAADVVPAVGELPVFGTITWV